MGLQHFSIGRDLRLPESTSSGCADWFAEGLFSDKASGLHKTAAIASMVGLGILSLVIVIGLPFYGWLIVCITTAGYENRHNEEMERDIQTRKEFIEALGGEAAVEALPAHSWAGQGPQFVNFDNTPFPSSGPDFSQLNGFESTDPISKGVIRERHYVMLRIHDLEKDEFFTQALVECEKNYRKVMADNSDPYVQEFLLYPGLINLPGNVRSSISLRTIDDEPFSHALQERPLSQATLQRISEIVKGQHPRFKLTDAPMQRLVQSLAV